MKKTKHQIVIDFTSEALPDGEAEADITDVSLDGKSVVNWTRVASYMATISAAEAMCEAVRRAVVEMENP